TPDLDTIKFNIPGGGAHTIELTSSLPAITAPIVVNGQTQPGYSGSPLIALRDASETLTGLDVRAGTSKIAGLAIGGFMWGIVLEDGDGDTVSGCWIGLDPAGAPSKNNTGIEIRDGSAGNLIGGTSTGARNVISGNDVGIRLRDAGTTGNTIKGNYVGTDPTGALAVGNSDGIIVEMAPGNTIGATGTAGRNVISGNQYGIFLSGATGTVVEGNFVGLDAAGLHGLGNTLVGLKAYADGNTIGGTTSGAGNVFSANRTGIWLDTGSSSNVVAGNLIGTTADGTAPLGNGLYGVALTDVDGNTVGGTTRYARNVISGQSKSVGVLIAQGDDNMVEGNYVGVDSADVISASRRDGVLVKTGSTGTKIAGNLIGLAADGTTILGNVRNGILLDAASTSTIGGTQAGAANTIAGSGASGVKVDGNNGAANGNLVQRNSIFQSGADGITLLNGGNHSTPAPAILGVTTNATATTIGLGLNGGAPSAVYAIEAFANPACDAATTREGKTYLVTKKLTTDATGHGT